jgi:hypothetical protein
VSHPSITPPGPDATEAEVLAWFNDLVATTHVHLLDGPRDNKRMTPRLKLDALDFADAMTNGGYWNDTLRDGYRCFYPPTPTHVDPVLGCRVAASSGWDIVVKPAPGLADCWAWAERWFAEVYLARHPEVALRLAMSDISERAICDSWNYNTEYAVWQLMQGQRTAWMRFEITDPKDTPLLDRVREAFAAAKGWWWWPDGADEAVFVPVDQWLQIYVRTLDDPDRGIIATVVRADGTSQTYLGREGIRRYIAEHGSIFQHGEEGGHHG